MQGSKNFYLLLGIHQGTGIGLSEDEKQETEKLWGVNIGVFVSYDWI